MDRLGSPRFSKGGSEARRTSLTTIIVKYLMPKCFGVVKNGKEIKRQQHTEENQDELKMERSLTLGDWLLAASPECKKNSPVGGGSHNCRLISETICSSLPGNPADFSLNSFSLETLLQFEKDDDGEAVIVSSLSRSQSRERNKKVRFRLPQEADIVIFCSPGPELDSRHQI